MSNAWLAERTEIFVRDLFRDFFESKHYFHSLYALYTKTAKVPFHKLDSWVGSETRKGPLWTLKDQSHMLFRSVRKSGTLSEHLFDWTIGSIFHESMKLKEDSYQVESYKPLLELTFTNDNNRGELAKIIQDYYLLIERASDSQREEFEHINELFSRALYHLRTMLSSYSSNLLLVRYLLDNQKLLAAVFTKKEAGLIFSTLFPGGQAEACTAVAEDCLRKGWNEAAGTYIAQALKRDPAHAKALSLQSMLTAADRHSD